LLGGLWKPEKERLAAIEGFSRSCIEQGAGEKTNREKKGGKILPENLPDKALLSEKTGFGLCLPLAMGLQRGGTKRGGCINRRKRGKVLKVPLVRARRLWRCSPGGGTAGGRIRLASSQGRRRVGKKE